MAPWHVLCTRRLRLTRFAVCPRTHCPQHIPQWRPQLSARQCTSVCKALRLQRVVDSGASSHDPCTWCTSALAEAEDVQQQQQQRLRQRPREDGVGAPHQLQARRRGTPRAPHPGGTWLDWLSAVVPCVGWLRTYHVGWLVHYLVAGFSVGSMVVPQGMSYASTAGAFRGETPTVVRWQGGWGDAPGVRPRGQPRPQPHAICLAADPPCMTRAVEPRPPNHTRHGSGSACAGLPPVYGLHGALHGVRAHRQQQAARRRVRPWARASPHICIYVKTTHSASGEKCSGGVGRSSGAHLRRAGRSSAGEEHQSAAGRGSDTSVITKPCDHQALCMLPSQRLLALQMAVSQVTS